MEQLLIIGTALFAASVVQGTVGFASGLLAIPLMLLAGLSLPEAIMVNLIAATVQNLLGTIRLREHLAWRATLLPIAIRLAAFPLGAVGLLWLDTLDASLVKQVVGGVVLAVLVAQWLLHVRRHQRLHPVWMWLAFSLSGAMAGFCGMGGPPMVLWVMAHRWSSEQSRAFQFFVFLAGMAPMAAVLLAMFGGELFFAVGIGVAAIPLAMLGTAAGLRLGSLLPRRIWRTLAFAVLIFVALAAIVGPML